MTCSMQLLPPYMEIGVSDTHRLARRPGTALVRRGGRPDTVVDRHNGAAGRHVRGRCCARSTAAKYSSGAVLRRYTGSPGASLTCSTPFDGNLARGSGRRGRRFKSCHPDCIPTGQSPYQSWRGPLLLPVPQQNTASTATNPNFDLLIERAPPARRSASLGRRGRLVETTAGQEE